MPSPSPTPLPRLERRGTSARLIVDERPLLIRGGELGNSAAHRAYLAGRWEELERLGLNAVVAPAYWELVEPTEGAFDWSTVDELIEDAAAHGMRVVLLWFGTWKNSMSCYAPEWVKTDTARFPRGRDAQGRPLEILTPFGDESRDADARAFAALMAHLREHDTDRTVVMVQVENEIGMIREAREHSDLAERAFASAVPDALLARLAEEPASLQPSLRARWEAAGARTAGTWTEVFGAGAETDEIFMAWAYARYVEGVAAAGRVELDLPLYANAALIRPGSAPGQYPSAGPLPHLSDVWRAGAPSLDFLAPDIYFPNFAEWATRYVDSGHPLFVPEALRSIDAAANALYAFGAHGAIGFSAFGIEQIDDRAGELLSASYDAIRQLSPLISEHVGGASMIGLLPPEGGHRPPHRVRLGDLELSATYEHEVSPGLADGVINEADDRAADRARLPAAAIVIRTGDDEFVIAGIGVTITFAGADPSPDVIGILRCDEGGFDDAGDWRTRRRLNGDETHQGRHVRLVPGAVTIQRVALYRYR
ncbi:DUF5597 domain-containing protein [Microbacterium karelineae]|uniref:GH35 family beta-galactosidase n=1 Tax=Microbacterium karelineae TaxID=2654283 RepID=UPI0012EADB90|nr:DUF5597 domain-containing protein [Microbacterium karelineae]